MYDEPWRASNHNLKITNGRPRDLKSQPDTTTLFSAARLLLFCVVLPVRKILPVHVDESVECPRKKNLKAGVESTL